VTIAEALAASGYRTGAITGAVIVSRSFGFAQGFEWFDELHGEMDGTRERTRAFLEAGDGRPTFLFVHTYRAHTPYAPDADVHARLAGDAEQLAEFAGTNQEIEKLLAAERTAADEARVAELAQSLEKLYRAGVAGLDREIGAFLDEPPVRALLERGFLVFTSDHGEAFMEHGELYHAGRVYDEQLRIPLLVRGPGIEPEKRGGLVSLADVTPTLAELAGLPPLPEWTGASLLRADASRPYQYAFECRDDRASTVAVIAGEHKLIGLLDADTKQFLGTHAAFDLAADPTEETDLVPGAVEWLDALYRHLEERREALVLPRIGPAPALLDQEQRADMSKLGYGGAEDG
jgi:arylsulfatase A-like enzyme